MVSKRRARETDKSGTPPKWFIPSSPKGDGIKPAAKKPKQVEKPSGFYVRPVEEIPIVDPLYDTPIASVSGDTWYGWSTDMPTEYYLCPSCLTGPGEMHLRGCTQPDMQRIGWCCPTCSVEPNTPHTKWCARADWDENPFKVRTGLTRFEFLEIIGFREQTWFGHGHPTPRNKRVGLFLFLDAGNYTSEPWRKPTLTRDEQQQLQQKLSPDFDGFPDDIPLIDSGA